MTDGKAHATHWPDCWREHLGCAVAKVERLQARVAALEGVLEGVAEKLPKTADGVVLCPGDKAWHVRFGRCGVCDMWVDDGGSSFQPDYAELYSSEQAAREAKEKDNA